jgi:hypothetical protein
MWWRVCQKAPKNEHWFGLDDLENLSGHCAKIASAEWERCGPGKAFASRFEVRSRTIQAQRFDSHGAM